MKLVPCAVLLAVSLAAAPAAAQQVALPSVPPVDSTMMIRVRLIDWRELVGRVVAGDDSSLTVVTPTGARVDLPFGEVRAWRPHDSRLFYRDPNTSRLFFGATARTLSKHDGYFANYYLYFPYLAYGMSDRLMLSAGVSILPAADAQLAYVAPKYQLVSSPRFHLAVGALWISLPDTDRPALGAGYAVATFGSENNAVSVLAGYPFATSDVSAGPIVMLGGERRIGGRTKLMAELWTVPDADAAPLVVGARWFTGTLAIDFGVAYPIGGDIGSQAWPVYPWVDFAVHW